MASTHSVSGDRERDVHAPVVLGIGGTLRSNSTSERALRIALELASTMGARTQMLTAIDLDLPMYDPYAPEIGEAAEELLTAVRRADGLIISTPAYHGGTSGLLKNALDHFQALATDPTPYIHDKAVGCIATAAGWQAGATTLASLRSTTHALRGWPTPLGVVVNSATNPFGPDGELLDESLGFQLKVLAEQVVGFARGRRLLV
jgi:FMN reductase